MGMILNMVYGGSGAGGGLVISTFGSAEALPTTADDGTIALITTTAIGNVLASKAPMGMPAAGDVWIELNHETGIEVTVAGGQIVIPIKSVRQFGEKWARLDAFARVNGVWMQVGVAAILYGFRREKANSDPYGRITYLHDAEGMTPMVVDLSTGTPDYGSWSAFIDDVCRPVMLKSDGTVDYELSHDNQTLKLDGTESDIANTSYDGNAMVEFRKFKWVHRSEDDAYEYVIFSDAQVDETYSAYAHTNASGVIQDAFYWSMFKGTLVDSKLRSIGTGTLAGDKTRAQEISYAQANGNGTDQYTNGWYTIYKSGWDYIADLLTLLAKSDDSQSVYGSGRTGANSRSAAGTLKNKCAFWGSSNETSDVKVLYIEGAWGNSWDSMAGIILDKTNGFKVKMTPPYNTTGSGYLETGIVPSGTSGGYADTNSCTDAMGYVPKTANGSATTFMCDALKFSTSAVRYSAIGGKHSDGETCGSRCLDVAREASYTYEAVGSRIAFLNV